MEKCLARLLILCACIQSLLSDGFERHPNDGWYNNLVHPDWGAIDTHLLRLSPADYSDGVYEPAGKERPNPFAISQIAFRGDNRLGSARNRNALLVFYGQQLVEEIMDVQRPGCPIEFFNIPVPKDHMYNPDRKDNLEMPFRRARYDQRTGLSPNNPRQQLNEITPYMDGTLVYGAGKAVEDAIRMFKDGLLKTTSERNIKESFPEENSIRLPYANPPSPRDHILRPVRRFRLYGNPRSHENPFLVTLSTVWFRYHNFVALDLKKKNPSWDDEALFLAARKRVIGQYQKITMYEWLPAFLEVKALSEVPTFRMSDYPYKGGGKNIYKGYSPNIHPGISTEFQAAAMRFGHTLVPAGVKTKRIMEGSCFDSRRPVQARFTNKADGYRNSEIEVNVTGIRLCNSFWVPEETVENPPGVDEIVRGMIYTRSAREDNILVSDIRESLFGPLDWSRRDLGALNIQRGRDLGLPGYNAVREAYGLPRVERWEDINEQSLYSGVIANLKNLYGNTTAPDDLDLFPGALLETTSDGPGPLFRAIILDQFLRIRHGDRFWYENEKSGLYSLEEIKEINSTTFFDVLNQVTGFYDRFIMQSIEPINVFICQPGAGVDCKCVDPDFDALTERDVKTREECVPLKHYNYFKGSEFSFIATVWIVILALPVTVAIMWLMVSLKRLDFKTKLNSQTPLPAGPNEFFATEWVGRTAYGLLNNRAVRVVLESQRKKVKVVTLQGRVVRMLDLRFRAKEKNKTPVAQVTTSCDKGYKMFLLAVPEEVDLVLYFSTMHERGIALDRMKDFFHNNGWELHENVPKSESVLWKEAKTIDMRKQVLAKFFQRVVSDVSGKADGKGGDIMTELEQEALNTKLTRTEFADALGLQPHSLFVRNMFLLVDSTGDGFVSFDEFKAYFGILCSGNADMKAEMFFKMFDTSRTGRLSRENYKKMIKSLVELNDSEDGNKVDINSIVDRIFQQMGKGQNGHLTMDEFKTIMFSDTADLWQSATLDLDVTSNPRPVARARSVNYRAQSFAARYSRKTRMNRAQSLVSIPQTVEISAQSTTPPETRWGLMLQRTERYVDNHSRAIFWVALYTLITIGIFIERAYYYSLEREHAGLRRIAGFGVSVTRGAASAQMFTLASLLLTMCRNTLTFYRETFLNRFIPLDNMHDMHIYISGLAMFFTVMHVVGHLINFYHISTQASTDLNCYFREYFRASHVLASFQYWTYQTVTGFTGVLLVVVMVIMYAFAVPFARRNLFKYFSVTHSLYILLYILLFLHGSARLVQDPLWGNFCVGPVVWFLVDKLISLSRKKVLLPVHKAELLPSGVINLVFKRPLTFEYHSGQWVRIACPLLGKLEYHPFTLTSSPHEDCLSLHIRAVGPWTKNLRSLFESNVNGRRGYPKVYVDGPFGESHQDWYKFPVSVLVGAGIGITPFASILKDIAHRAKNLSRVPCQKVYFLWVTRTQRSFEWMTDIIRQVEATDTNNFVEVQICITQLKQKFDLRTTMLYICERHFQKIAGLSMFTGLRAKTHFGRPKFTEFFGALKMVHEHVPQIGVFSCGPAALTRNVNQACAENNAYTGPSLIHHFENF